MNEDLVGSYGTWSCGTCGIQKLGTAHQRRQKFCSNVCYGKHRSEFLHGEASPSYKAAANKVCEHCGSSYNSYNKSRRFCSRKCSGQHSSIRRGPKKVRQKMQRPAAPTVPCAVCGKKIRLPSSGKNRITCSIKCSEKHRAKQKKFKSCLVCGTGFRVFPSSTRRYCSYECHLKDGGAFKAGMASAKAKMKYGAKRDANHSEVIAAMKKHCGVYDVSSSGMGIPDGLAWINGAWHLFDIKNPKTAYGKRGLNPIQKKWLNQSNGGPIYLIYSVEEAERFAQGNFDGLKFEEPEKEVDWQEAPVRPQADRC